MSHRLEVGILAFQLSARAKTATERYSKVGICLIIKCKQASYKIAGWQYDSEKKY